jgi:hypothetical protein
MRGTTNLSQRSLKKKKPIRFLQNRRTRKKPLGQRIANIALSLTIFVVFTAMMISLGKNLILFYSLKQTQKILIENQQVCRELEKKVIESKTPAFIEHYVREKLDMLKSGEFVIIIRSE